MTETERSGPTVVVELGDLGFDGGAHVLVAWALRSGAAGDELAVRGTHPALLPHLRAWCTAQGHSFLGPTDGGGGGRLARGTAPAARWVGAGPAGSARVGEVEATAPAEWGLAPRGAWVEAGGPRPRFALSERDEIWSDDAGRLYERALAGQWDPATAIPWAERGQLEPAVEAAIVQVMAYLVENEAAALLVPARFLGQIHPHFAEVQHLLAVQVADEARHAHVFARRADLATAPPALSGAGGRASLQGLLDEPSFGVAAFLLSVLGEGAFVSLLGFLERHAPDACTRTIAQLVRSDEARHVAFGVSHLERHCQLDPGLRPRLAAAVERRFEDLRSTAGLNQDVFDSLVVLAAGSLRPEAVARGWRAVQELQVDMREAREARLGRLGFSPGEAEALAALHTRNFM